MIETVTAGTALMSITAQPSPAQRVGGMQSLRKGTFIDLRTNVTIEWFFHYDIFTVMANLSDWRLVFDSFALA